MWWCCTLTGCCRCSEEAQSAQKALLPGCSVRASPVRDAGGQISLSLLPSHIQGAEQLCVQRSSVCVCVRVCVCVCVCDSKKTPHWVPPSELRVRAAQAQNAARCRGSWRALGQPNRPTRRHSAADSRGCSLQSPAPHEAFLKARAAAVGRKHPAVYRLEPSCGARGWI